MSDAHSDDGALLGLTDDPRFYDQLESQVNRVTAKENLSEADKLLAIRHIVDGVVSTFTDPSYASETVTSSKLPPELDRESLEYLARMQNDMKSRKYDPEEIRSALEIAEHGALVKQQHREEEYKRVREKIREETKVASSVLPSMDNISLNILAKFDTLLRAKGTPDNIRRRYLENAERGVLIRQRWREKRGKASVGDSFDV